MTKKGAKGFGYLKQHDPERFKEISKAGGEAAQKKGTGHRWSPTEARNRGRQGGATRWRGHKGKG